ncbi:hypothetical protein BC567DRAFT_262360 [Phyllosticta citribraziliensis]
MGNAKSKPKKCFLQGCVKPEVAKTEVSKTESLQYEDLWLELYAATYAVWKIGSRNNRLRIMLTFESLKGEFEACPPSIEEIKEMTKKGYERITYRAMSQYKVSDQDNADLKTVTPMGHATLWIPVVEIRWSTWSNHTECHREAPPLSFRISMIRDLIDKAYSMLDKNEQAAVRMWTQHTRQGKVFDFDNCYAWLALTDDDATLAGSINEKGESKRDFPFSGVLDAMVGDERGEVPRYKIARCEAAAQAYRNKYGTERPDVQASRSWSLQDPRNLSR